MTVEENLEVAQYSIAPLISAAVARQEREALLARTGLTDAARLPARALPLLRRKRLEVARALALKPRVVLLDEVGAGLVDSEITEFITLIRSIIDPNTAIVIVEHVIRVVRECCSRSIVLNFGKKLIEGPDGGILANDEVAAVYLGTGGARERGALCDGNGRRSRSLRPCWCACRGTARDVAPDCGRVRRAVGVPFARIRGIAKLWPSARSQGNRPDCSRRRSDRDSRRQWRRKDDARSHDHRRHRTDLRRPADRRRRYCGSSAASHRRPRDCALHGRPANLPNALGRGKLADRSPERERFGQQGTSELRSTICSRFSPNARTTAALRCQAASSRCSQSGAR